MQQADYVAWNVRAVVSGEALLPFRYENLGEMLSLGDQSATIAALAQAVRLNGPVAYAVRRAVYAARMPTSTQAAKVGLSWAVDAAFGARCATGGPAARQEEVILKKTWCDSPGLCSFILRRSGMFMFVWNKLQSSYFWHAIGIRKASPKRQSWGSLPCSGFVCLAFSQP